MLERNALLASDLRLSPMSVSAHILNMCGKAIRR